MVVLGILLKLNQEQQVQLTPIILKLQDMLVLDHILHLKVVVEVVVLVEQDHLTILLVQTLEEVLVVLV